MKIKYDKVYTPHLINYSLFVIGMVIVWLATHSWLGLLGAFIASAHIAIIKKESAE